MLVGFFFVLVGVVSIDLLGINYIDRERYRNINYSYVFFY